MESLGDGPADLDLQSMPRPEPCQGRAARLDRVRDFRLALVLQVKEVVEGAVVDAPSSHLRDVCPAHRVRLAGPRLTVREDADVVPVQDRPDEGLRLHVDLLLRGRVREDLVEREHCAPLCGRVVQCHLPLVPVLHAAVGRIACDAARPHPARQGGGQGGLRAQGAHF